MLHLYVVYDSPQDAQVEDSKYLSKFAQKQSFLFTQLSSCGKPEFLDLIVFTGKASLRKEGDWLRNKLMCEAVIDGFLNVGEATSL
jgi:hypothetical protein